MAKVNSHVMFQIRKAVVHLQMFFKIGVLKNFLRISQEKSCVTSFFNKVAGLKSQQLYSKETPVQEFSCGIGEIF